MLGTLNGIETLYGRMTGFDPLRTVVVSRSLIRVYVLIRFQKGPLYTAFDCYKAQDGWIIPSLNWNTKPDIILPKDLLDGVK
jgi:hypothetical protein